MISDQRAGRLRGIGRRCCRLRRAAAVVQSLPETSIETTSRWPRNRHESSGPTTVPADFVERLGDGAVDRDVEFWERLVSDIRNLRALMTA